MSTLVHPVGMPLFPSLAGNVDGHANVFCPETAEPALIIQLFVAFDGLHAVNETSIDWRPVQP